MDDRFTEPQRVTRVAAPWGVFGALAWAYGPTLYEVAGLWQRQPLYSHGYFIPLLALMLLWYRRRELPEPTVGAQRAGVGCLLLAGGMRLAAAYTAFDWLDAISLLPSLAGAALVLTGRPGLRWAWPAVAILVFMLPLPYRVELALNGSLQRFATLASTRVLNLLGYPASARGNVITLDGLRLGVEEACSGLGLFLVLLALVTALVFLKPRPAWERGVLLLSAVPIALAANAARVTATAVVLRRTGEPSALAFFHDLAGWVMLPAALALVGVELSILAYFHRRLGK